ncbi:MAG: cyanophycinase [Acidobacteria bacterium]|nr:cyanophycinase [Candidatus Sulfomarinibacter kjeldsenii]
MRLADSRVFVLTVIVLATTTLGVAADIGPTNGSLVVAGGGVKDPAIYERFVSLAGGPEAPIVVIPTAGSGETYGDFWPGLQRLREAGAVNLKVLHTRDPQEADREDFVAPLRQARGVWFSGGRQWRLVDAYRGTQTLTEIRGVLERGGVIGGSSAGATIQGSYLVRGDSSTNTIMMGDHTEGFGFLANVGIDQHLLQRNRHFDLVEVIEAHPELLGIGLDEDTAIVVRGDTFEVIGNGYVAIYDSTNVVGDGWRFYFLAPGDRYDLSTRQPTRQTYSPEPFEDVISDQRQP